MADNKKKQYEYVYKRTSCYDVWDNKTFKEVDKFAQDYISFLNNNKTERLCVKNWQAMLEKLWYKDIDKIWNNMKAGDKAFYTFRNKNLFAIVKGKKSIKEWFRLICAHIDSPRIDLKYIPFYDSDGFCLLKTHYYGWIKKYQRVTIPLSMIWVVFDKNGKKVEINIGEEDTDPVFFLSDLLPHLGAEQMKKDWSKVIEAEDMNLIVGSAYSPAKEEKPKENILKLLFEKYWITEKDFTGAEIEIVPNSKAREIWFDRSLIWWYGHDDRACSYTAMRALMDYKGTPEYTTIIYWVDKEEIGSLGATSAESRVFRNLVSKLYSFEDKNFSMVDLNEIFFRSKAISADVPAIMDPSFKSAFDPLNTAIVNHGVILEKYTWARWKYHANDADAEYVAELKNHFDKTNVIYQFGGLGKVDLWGWGTISMHFAQLGINIIDMWVGILSTHAPIEVLSKADLYATYQAYKSFIDLK